jgi:CheY-like chemotaxis protein
VLIVDDEPSVHDITLVALSDFRFAGRGLEFIHAYSGAQAIALTQAHPDIAVMLVDVVMENDHSGLDFVRHVREEAGLRFPRIILRTGQPGQAPEREVITQYDINDYKQKTELTQEKMFTVMHTSIASYRDLIALDHSRRGLRKIIEAAKTLYEFQSIEQFAQGVLEQLAALLYLDQETLVVRTEGLAAAGSNADIEILAGTGQFSSLIGKKASEVLDPQLFALLVKSSQQGNSLADGSHFTAVYETRRKTKNILYIAGKADITPPQRELIDLFCQCVAQAQDTLQTIHTKLAAGGAAP